MSQPRHCPYCGSPDPASPARGGACAPSHSAEAAIGSLYAEVRRIREIAEDRELAQAQHRIAELTREVHELRVTVARLRATASA